MNFDNRFSKRTRHSKDAILRKRDGREQFSVGFDAHRCSRLRHHAKQRNAGKQEDA